jgi:hypothetical protein
MAPWVANWFGLFLALTTVVWLALALLWRFGSWKTSNVELLTHTEGLRIGAEAPDIAGYVGEQEMHVSLEGRETFVVFGTEGCEPCVQLLAAAAVHPATRSVRKIYFSDGALDDPELVNSWEIYRFHDENAARRAWRAPVSPYFHLVDAGRRVVAKGVANRPEHLDRLLAIPPPAMRSLHELALSEPLQSAISEEG